MTPDQNLAIAGLIFTTILSIGTGFYFYLKSKREIRASFHVTYTILLGGTRPALPSEVEVTFAGRKIDHLRKMNIIIWNSGTEPIRRSDIVGNSFAEITFPSDVSTILKASVLKSSSVANDVTINSQADNGTATIALHYLDPKQGFNIEILYTGERVEPNVRGTVIGMPNGIEKAKIPDGKYPPLWFFGVLFILGMAIVLPIIREGQMALGLPSAHEAPWSFVGILYFVGISLVFIILWVAVTTVLAGVSFRWIFGIRDSIPKELET